MAWGFTTIDLNLTSCAQTFIAISATALLACDGILTFSALTIGLCFLRSFASSTRLFGDTKEWWRPCPPIFDSILVECLESTKRENLGGKCLVGSSVGHSLGSACAGSLPHNQIVTFYWLPPHLVLVGWSCGQLEDCRRLLADFIGKGKSG